jgi:septum formation protein
MYKQIENPRLILASSSPRRKELLMGLGLKFEVCSPDCDENVLLNERPVELVKRLSLKKALVGAKQFSTEWVIGADTIVVIDDKILGKPENEADAQSMLRQLQGRKHKVFGGFALVNSTLGKQYIEAHDSEVEMMPLSEEEIHAYVKTREPMDKAGSYAIQGIGAGLISRVEGSYTNVVGLNIAALRAVLVESGVLYL